MIDKKKLKAARTELATLATAAKCSLPDLLADETRPEFAQTCAVLYKAMPTMVRWTMKEDKFLEFVVERRAMFQEQLKQFRG